MRQLLTELRDVDSPVRQVAQGFALALGLILALAFVSCGGNASAENGCHVGDPTCVNLPGGGTGTTDCLSATVTPVADFPGLYHITVVPVGTPYAASLNGVAATVDFGDTLRGRPGQTLIVCSGSCCSHPLVLP